MTKPVAVLKVTGGRIGGTYRRCFGGKRKQGKADDLDSPCRQGTWGHRL